ncbi:MAG: hypothetical protein J6D42_11635 [Clostridia bacterium]|nr:hypothetical protein [Clostridia bacterium]
MKVSAILEVNGKEIKLEIPEEEIKKLIEASEKSKKTGYERVDYNKDYYYVGWNGEVEIDDDAGDPTDDTFYDIANYYSDKTVAQNNGRADTLMRKLRRFAVKHREKELDWTIPHTYKHSIYYDHQDKALYTYDNQVHQNLGSIYFDTKETAKAAIEEFKDELIWYFTEYKDSL